MNIEKTIVPRRLIRFPTFTFLSFLTFIVVFVFVLWILIAGDSSLPSGAVFRSPVIPKEESRGIFRNAGGQLGGILHGGFGLVLRFRLPVTGFIRL
jgi:hypothetical protein